jgi:ABC-type phosphate transport system auxiliary subunit
MKSFLKNMIFAEEPKKEESATVTPPSTGEIPRPSLFVVSDNNEIYTQLLEKTRFESTEPGKVIHGLLSGFDALPLQEDMKFKAASMQAKKLNGLTDEAILSAYDLMKTQLQKEQDDFTASSQQFEQAEIVARNTKLQELATQLSQLQAELSQVSTDLAEAQGNFAKVKSQFGAAFTRRISEIDQEKMRTTALIKG